MRRGRIETAAREASAYKLQPSRIT